MEKANDKIYREIRKIVDDLREGNAVLVIGPEIYQVNGVPLQRYVRQRVQEEHQDKIAAYYERDGFFILKDQADKPEIRETMADIFLEIKPDTGLLEKIVRMPFSVMVSANPDTFLSETAFQLGVKHKFHSFYPNAPEVVDEPTKDFPLIYNIAGNIRRETSLLLDYDDLMRLVEGLISAPKLPETLRAKMGVTKSFLFLGFQFDRWYTQLFLRLLNMNQAVRRLSDQLPAAGDEDVQAFLLKHFRIQFLGEEYNLVDMIYQACSDAGILRQAIEMPGEKRAGIVLHLQKGEPEKAVELLLDASRGTDLYDQATLLSGELSGLVKNQDSTDSRDLVTGRNRIANSILELTKQLPEL